MEPLVLTDPNVQPTEELIFSLIGEKSRYWEQMIDYLYDNHFDISEEWRYYTDGKSWLYRTLRKKNTIYWIGVQKDSFRVSFWIAEKSLPVIEASSLPDSIKEEYRNAKSYNKSRCITIVVNSDEDFDLVLKLIDLKLKLK